MDPTSRYFEKLRRLAVTLETETANLQQAYQNYVEDNDNTVDAARVLLELHSEVKGLKGQVHDQLVQQKAKEEEVRSFIEACMVMKQRFSADIDRVRRHCEKYGYQAPANTQKSLKVKVHEPEAPGKGGEEEEDEAEAVGGEEEAGEDLPPVTPLKMPPPSSPDPMRTPQLSDFGLSEMHLKKVLGVAELTSEVAPMPALSLPPPSLYMSMQPPMPKTPKCALLMGEEDEPLTPHLSEHTMCLNNDFTMDLHRKDVKKTQSSLTVALGLSDQPPHILSTPPLNSVMDSLATNDSMESPEPPVLCTPGFKLTKTNACSPSPLPGVSNLESPGCPGNLQTTPEIPAFQTPYINRLLSTKKGAREQETADTQEDDDDPIPGLSSPSNRASAFKHPWEYNVPEISMGYVEDKRTPEMPKLELFFGSNLLPSGIVGGTGALSGHNPGAGEPSVPGLDLDGPTEEFSLGTPRVRGDYMPRMPSTPEMPDLSSVTLDISKHMSQTQSKKSPVTILQPHPRSSGKENWVQYLSVVSESEFMSLPSYLRRQVLSLTSLNQAVQKINSAAARQHHGEQAEFLMEDLKRIAGLGTNAPIYFLCLKELKRLEHVQGLGNNSVYRLLSN